MDKRPGAYYGKLGYMAGLGRSSLVIAEEMGDGIHPSYVRTLLTRWGIPQPQPYCQVPLSCVDRYALNYRAEQEGIEPEEWLRRLVSCALKDNLYSAIVAGRYGASKKPRR